MRTYLVEVSPPFFDQNLCLGARTKPFEAQTLVAKLAVEALGDVILPRLALLTPPLQKKELGGACALLIDKGAVNTRE